MFREMPALISINQSIITGASKLPSEPSQPTNQQIPSKKCSTEAELLKNLNDQIQVVNQIQQKLLTEQKKLEMMLRRFHAQNSARKIPALTSDSLKIPPKHKRICNHGSVDINLVLNRSNLEAEEKSDCVEKTGKEEYSKTLILASGPLNNKCQPTNQNIIENTVKTINNNNNIFTSTGIQNLTSQPPPYQSPTHQMPCKIFPSDNEQIQLVNKIKKKLLTEQNKLEMVLKGIYKQGVKRKIPDLTSDKLKNQPKHIRIDIDTENHETKNIK